MMNKFLMAIALLLVLFNGYSQSIEEIEKSGKYVYGVGESEDCKAADKEALVDLVSQIEVAVHYKFDQTINEEDIKRIKESTEIKLQTSSDVNLSGAVKKEEKSDGKCTVIRYLTNEQFAVKLTERVEKQKQVFEKRKQRIQTYVMSAKKDEKEYKIGSALRNYYWALILLHDYPESLTLDEDGKNDLSVKLKGFIKDIIANVSTKSYNENINAQTGKREISFDVFYKNHLVQDQSFRYWDETEDGASEPYKLREGIGIIVSDRASTVSGSNDYKIKIDYRFEDEMHLDPEVKEIFDMGYGMDFGNILTLQRNVNVKDKFVLKLITLGGSSVYIKENENDFVLETNSTKEDGVDTLFIEREAGVYEIKVSKKGYIDIIRKINIENSKMIRLEPEPKKEGTLIVKDPGGINAEIILNKSESEVSQIIEKTPTNLPVGKYNICLKKDGYETFSQNIQIDANDTTEISTTKMVVDYSRIEELKKQRIGELKEQTRSYRFGRNFWFLTTMISTGVGAYAYWQGEELYKEYQTETDSDQIKNLRKDIDKYDQAYPVAFGVAGFCIFYRMVTSGLRKEKRKKLNEIRRLRREKNGQISFNVTGGPRGGLLTLSYKF